MCRTTVSEQVKGTEAVHNCFLIGPALQWAWYLSKPIRKLGTVGAYNGKIGGGFDWLILLVGGVLLTLYFANLYEINGVFQRGVIFCFFDGN